MNYEQRYNRRLQIAKIYVETNGTVRKVAKALDIPKSTVHNELKKFANDPHAYEAERELARKAKLLIEKNKQERHKRGGLAVHQKSLIAKSK